MNKKIVIHAIIVMTIVVAAFFTAAFFTNETYAKTPEKSVVANIAKVDFENRTVQTKMIVDSEVPLTAPETYGVNPLGWIILSASAILSGIVIIEEVMDRKTQQKS